MNKLLTGTMALAAMIAGPAMAADMPVKAPPPVPVFSWTGCYIGIQGGYKWGRSKHTYNGNVNGVPTVLPGGVGAGTDFTPWFNVTGMLGGGEGGCNYQVGNWVWGIEVDGSTVAASGQSGPFTNLVALGAVVPTEVFKTDERWLATARGRIGYAQDKWLWYITGGAAWAGFDITEYNSLLPIPSTAIARLNRVGWIVGFGTEYAVAYGWSVKWETSYMDFGTFGSNLSCAPVLCGGVNIRMTEWRSNFGLNYKFNWGYGPVVAKY